MVFLFAGLSLLFFGLPAFAGSIVFENDHFSYEISKEGRNLHFIDKATGTDYLFNDSLSYCATIRQNGKEVHSTSLSLKNGLLNIEFGNTGVKAVVRVGKARNGITMEVIEVKGAAESLTFINVPLKLEGMPSEPFAACVLSMNLFTRVQQLPALQTHLWATCYQRFGMTGAMITLLGVPQKEILPVIRKVMEQAKDIPHSTAGGAWAQMQKEGYGSYLMNFGTLTEETVPEWIEMCSNLGFNQIDNHGGGNDFFRFGDFVLNSKKWPDGWEHFKRINQRLHKAGISSIFHTYAFFIDKNSKYVAPVPSPDLAYFNSFTLAKPIGADDDEIVVKESTANISMITGFFVRNSVTLHIGDELVSFSGVTNTSPYKFTGCKRGMNGTKKSAHAAQDMAYHLREMFGRFVPGVETPLFGEIARRTAEVVNECNFDGIYFDAIDGSDILASPGDSWYYGTKFIFEVAKQLKHPVGMEMSAMLHHWWHYRSRWQAWDRPVRGYKRFIDIHTASIKSSEHEHGFWSGYLPLIEKYAKADNGGLLLPLHLGWWGNQTWSPPQVEPTFPDDIEYLCCKMIGNNAGLSMLGGADKKTLDENPLFKRLMPIIKQYEALRHQNYFNDTIRSLLRQPEREFTLFQDKIGNWNFKPIEYQKHKISGLDDSSSHWKVNNKFDPQPVRLRIEPQMAVRTYGDSASIILADFSAQKEFVKEGTAAGISGGIRTATEKTIHGEGVGIFSAFSTGTSPRNGSWIKMEKKFEPWKNLERNQALGVWIHGDGNGELLNFRIESPEHLSFGARGDHFVKIDFTGWKYCELVEIESAEFNNYSWPNDRDVYSTYRTTVLFKSIDKLQLWYNNLPAGKEVSCQIGQIKALSMIPVSITNPSVTINGVKLIIPVKMDSGMYLELNSGNDCKLYGKKGELIKEVKVEGTIPSLASGINDICFSGNGTEGINTRVQVTVISEGNPLSSGVKNP